MPFLRLLVICLCAFKVLDIMVRVPGMVKQMTGVDVTNVRRATSVY
jgi:hypothetical protein